MGTILSGRQTLGQLVKYGAVGVLNTLITALVIYVCQELWGMNPVTSNALGYVAGLVNSFVFNSRWTFKSAFSWRNFIGFMVAFGVCYVIQLLVLLALRKAGTIPPYPQQLIAMVVYTGANFLLNKFVVFHK